MCPFLSKCFYSELKLVKTNIIPKNQLNHLYRATGEKGHVYKKKSDEKAIFCKSLVLLFLSLEIYKKKVYQTQNVKYVLIDFLPSDLKDQVRFTISSEQRISKNLRLVFILQLITYEVRWQFSSGLVLIKGEKEGRRE